MRGVEDVNSAVVGTVTDLEERGQLLGKVGSVPVVVFWSSGRPWAIEDRCPHMGFPLHRGTLTDGLVICHWHHARFDLASGCTLDLWADDAVGFDVEIEGPTVRVTSRPATDDVPSLERRLEEGLQEQITLVIAKSVHRLLARGVSASRSSRSGSASRCGTGGPGGVRA